TAPSTGSARAAGTCCGSASGRTPSPPPTVTWPWSPRMLDTGLVDGRTRELLRTDHDRTFFVEAGAGTGKTTEVTGRIVQLMAAGRLRPEQLVAITFTEAAAAELRARVRQELERAGADPARPASERERCLAATAEIDRASIDTIHAFAAQLLRTYPLEAGLPPELTTLDDIEQDLRFDERFRAWFEQVADDQRHREAVRRCLLLGLAPNRMEQVARALQEQRDLLTRDTSWPAPTPGEPAVEVAHRVGRRLEETIDLVDRSAPDGHALHEVAGSCRFPCERLRAAGTELEALAALARVEWLRGTTSGKADGWDGECRQAKAGFREVIEIARETLAAHRQVAFSGLAQALRDFTLAEAAARAREGSATFHDLLTWARDLLRDDLEVRTRAQRRWSRVFVDEFQDTDPLQAELAFYLCANPDAPPNLPSPNTVGHPNAPPEIPSPLAGEGPGEGYSWQALRPTPGKLCRVGDPQPSINRFRRADIA